MADPLYVIEEWTPIARTHRRRVRGFIEAFAFVHAWRQTARAYGGTAAIFDGGAVATMKDPRGRDVPVSMIILEPSPEALAEVEVREYLHAPAGSEIWDNRVKGVVR